MSRKPPRHHAAGAPSTDGAASLGERDVAILKDVIVTHMLSAEPVSSRTVCKYGQLGLSAATIRNVMADLEEQGFLVQPHTSAGRIPTPRAYHLFIDELMSAKTLSDDERQYIRQSLDGARDDSEGLMSVASHLLSELSQQVGVVLTPALAETTLRRVEFVPLSDDRSGHKVLCVVVSESGFVDTKLVETHDPVAREDLIRISNYLTENFTGMTLREIRQRLVGLMAQERAHLDRLMALTIEVARKGLDMGRLQDVLVEGTNEVLNLPELADLERVRKVLEAFSDKARLVYLLTECMRGKGVRVLIGEDSDLTSELGFSLVANTYSVDDLPLGTLGVFGPSRMEYPRLIPLVDYLGRTLSRALSECLSERRSA